jgi:hypothetical protein
MVSSCKIGDAVLVGMARGIEILLVTGFAGGDGMPTFGE